MSSVLAVSGAVAQGSPRLDVPSDIDLDAQFLDLGDLDAPASSSGSRPDAKAAGAALPVKPSAPNMRLEWVGVAKEPALDGKADAAAMPTDYGVQVKMRPPITVGVLAQFAQPGETYRGPGSLADQKPLTAAVASMQVLPGLSLDTRTAWGQFEPDASASGGHTGHRRTVDVRLAQNGTFGAWRFSPSVSLNYLEERRNAPAAETEATPTTGAGRVDVRPEVAYRFDLQNSMFVEPKAMLGGFWGIGEPAATGSAAHSQLRLKGEASVTIGSMQGAKVEIGGAVEEGAVREPDVWSGRLQLSVPLK
ncbi:MAG TPA: hypothetical protein VFR73_24715 [Hyphomicrobiaceae bacterium]|nr:hypothetical protein [Hyphomicrobiaceae bacterium]